MKKYINHLMAAAVIATCGTMTTSCSDPEDVQNLTLDRVLSPTGISARVSENLNIIVSWDEMSGATEYEVEGYIDAPDYTRTPDYTATKKNPIDTLKNLIGETTYYIRVRALDRNNSNRSSKWVEIDRTTGAEQNMSKAKAADITSTSVTVHWTAGIQADKLLAIPTSAGSSAEEVIKDLTAEEIANGVATITGLLPETNYKIALKYGDKTRGYTSIKTNIDFSDATVLTADGDWVNAIQDAAAGTKFALAPGTYTLTDAKLKINNTVMIGAQNSANLPVLNTCIQIYGGAGLHLYQVILDGTDTDGSQAIDYKEAGSFSPLTIDGCEVRNYTKGFYYINLEAAITGITINNSIIHDIVCEGGDMFDCRKGYIADFKLTNSTIYDSAIKRDVFRMDDNSSSLGGNPVYFVDHNTFHNVGSGSAKYRIFYIRYAGNTVTFTNNVVSGFNNLRGFANTSATDANPTLKNNYYFNTKNLLSKDEENTETPLWYDGENGTELTENPFENAAEYNFYLNTELLRSYEVGDPRWY
jgi:hypothetical protein